MHMKPLSKRALLGINLTAVLVGLAPIFLYSLYFAGSVAPSLDVPFHSLRPFEQWLAVGIAFGVKPLYMALALGWMVWLWRQPARDLASLRWGLIWFWLGENACSINYLFFARGSDLWEYFHNYGMAVGFSFMIYALLEAVDVRVFKLSPPRERCAALGLCGGCAKYSPMSCRLQRVFKLLLPAVVLAAMLPLTAGFKHIAYRAEILGRPQFYSHPMSCQLFENDFCAALGVLLVGASWLVLMLKRDDPLPASKALLAAGLGPLAFGATRLFFTSTFSQNLLWFDVWEELTELLFILGIGAVLWTFRAALFGKVKANANEIAGVATD
jgi:hypothetical protein